MLGKPARTTDLVETVSLELGFELLQNVLLARVQVTESTRQGVL